MPHDAPLPQIGTLVTVTVTDDLGKDHIYHGMFRGTRSHLTRENDTFGSGRRPTYTRFGDEADLYPELGQPALYARVHSATGDRMPRHNLADTGVDWWFDGVGINVRVESENVTLCVADESGQAWVKSNQSVENQRYALLDQIEAMNPELGQQARTVIQTLIDDAYRRGQSDESRNHGSY